MTLGGTHWFIAVGIALLIHVAGVLWLSVPEPVRRSMAEQAGESIVVMLGRDAGRSAADAEAVVPQSATDVRAPGGEAARQPAVTEETAAPAADAAAVETTFMDLSDLDTASTVDPGPVESTSAPEPAAAAPAEETDNIVAAGRETLPAQAAPATAEAAQSPVEARQAPGTLIEEATGSEPEQSSVQPGAAAASVKSAPTQEAAAPSPGLGEAVPTEFADAASVPEPAGSTVTVATAAAVSTAPAVSGENGGQPVKASRSETVNETPAVQVEQSASGEPVESVAAASANQQEVEVAAVRQPDQSTNAEPEPEVSEAEKPQVIDLQELRENDGGSGVAARYAGVLKGWLQKNMHYPRAARLNGQEGRVVVRFVIDRTGRVRSIKVESKSGYPLLDREAREMIERGDPFPEMPEDMPGQQLEVRVPVNFHVRDETLTKEIPPIYLK